jgi:hypothetical protein
MGFGRAGRPGRRRRRSAWHSAACRPAIRKRGLDPPGSGRRPRPAGRRRRGGRRARPGVLADRGQQQPSWRRRGDSNSTSLFASITGQEPVVGATCGFRDCPVTASARRCPWFACRLRTQHGPTGPSAAITRPVVAAALPAWAQRTEPGQQWARARRPARRRWWQGSWRTSPAPGSRYR